MSGLVTPTGTKGCASHVALAAPFVSGQKGVFCPGCQTRDKKARPGVSGWKTGTIEFSQPEQMSVSVVEARRSPIPWLVSNVAAALHWRPQRFTYVISKGHACDSYSNPFLFIYSKVGLPFVRPIVINISNNKYS